MPIQIDGKIFIHLIETDRLEIRTKFEFHRYTEFIENKSKYSNMYVILVILANKNKK